MAAIVTRAGKGSPLTNAELDANFTNLNAELGTKGVGDVVGPAVATHLSIPAFNGTSGKLLSSGGATLDAVGQMALIGASAALTFSSRSGSGSNWVAYNPSGVDFRLFAAPGGDKLTLTTGGLLTLNGAAAGMQVVATTAATVANSFLTFFPSDYGVGKPQFFIQKTATADLYTIGLWDTAGSPGMIDFAVANVRVQGTFLALNKITAATGFHTYASVAFWIYKTSDGSAAGLRWQVGQDNAAEGGGNAGANFCINRYTDAGVFVDRSFVIDRDTALAKFSGDVVFNSGSGTIDKPEPRGRYYRNANAPGDYTFQLVDQGALISSGSVGTASTFTVPPNSAVAFPVNTRIDIAQWQTGALSVAPGAGVTLLSASNKRKLAGQFSGATLVKMAVDTWWLVGDLTA